MKVFMQLLLLGLVAAVASAAEQAVEPSSQEVQDALDQLPGEVDESEPTSDEEDRFNAGPCSQHGGSAKCCVRVKRHSVCINMDLRPRELRAVVGLTVNNKKIIEHDIVKVGAVCKGVGPVKGCLEITRARVNIKQKLVDACFGATLPLLPKINLGCMKMERGKFSHHR